MNKVLIVIAYYKEINEHKNQVGKLWKVNDKVDICISGIGLRDFFVDLSKYDKVYNVGTCGAIPDKAKVGDTVRIVETRPISKTKYFYLKEIVKEAVIL